MVAKAKIRIDCEFIVIVVAFVKLCVPCRQLRNHGTGRLIFAQGIHSQEQMDLPSIDKATSRASVAGAITPHDAHSRRLVGTINGLACWTCQSTSV